MLAFADVLCRKGACRRIHLFELKARTWARLSVNRHLEELDDGNERLAGCKLCIARSWKQQQKQRLNVDGISYITIYLRRTEIFQKEPYND